MGHEGAFFKELCEQTHVAMFVVNPSDAFRFVYVNSACCRHFQREFDDLMTLTIVDVDPEATVEGCQRFWQRLATETKIVFRAQHLRKDGTVIPVEVTSSLCEVGSAIYFVGYVTDLTDRLAAEREKDRIEAERRAARHMDGLVQMAGALAHDFNNMLVGVLANAGYVKSLCPVDSPEHGAVLDIEEAARLLAGSCRQLLAIAGRGRFVTEPFDLTELVEATRTELRGLVPTHVDLEIVPPVEGAIINGHDLQIRQMLVNLVQNAADAVEHRGRRIVVSVGVRHLGAERLAKMRGSEGLRPGPYVFVDIGDDGPGVDPAVLERMFEPLVTARTGRRGLGLAAVLGIVTGHGGAVEVETGGSGTRMRIWFPAVQEPVVERVPTVPPVHTRCILVVDDEPGVRRAVSRILTLEGYHVETAEDGVVALEVIERRNDIACVLLDLTMPRMDGREALRQIRALRPELPVIITSGFDARDAAPEDEVGFVAFLPKPFDPQSLGDAVRSVLFEQASD